MIAIINTGERDAKGRTRYRLQINAKLITEFTHKHTDGLGECLRRAAEAADKAHAVRVDAILRAAAIDQWRSLDTPDTDKEFNYGVQGS